MFQEITQVESNYTGLVIHSFDKLKIERQYLEIKNRTHPLLI